MLSLRCLIPVICLMLLCAPAHAQIANLGAPAFSFLGCMPQAAGRWSRAEAEHCRTCPYTEVIRHESEGWIILNCAVETHRATSGDVTWEGMRLHGTARFSRDLRVANVSFAKK